MAQKEGLSGGEQWAMLLVPVGLLFGYLLVAKSVKAQTKGLGRPVAGGDCGCGCNGQPGGCGQSRG